MLTPDLATLVTAVFVRHLAAERNVSRHTIGAYRDTLKLLLRFARDLAHRPITALRFEDLTPELILQFLTHLETDRRNTIRTRNARLAAIHSFFRYVLEREPALATACQRVLAIPIKKSTRPLLGYLTEAELAHLLAQVDRAACVFRAIVIAHSDAS
jgi:site-specific recombinase XerD